MSADPSVPCYDEVWQDVYGDIQRLGPVHRHMRRLLAELMGELEFRTVVDAGCGAGDNVELLREGGEVERFVGLDVSEEALTRAKSRYPGEYHKLDVQTESLDERFDLVFSSLVLEHLPDDAGALRNMRAMTGQHLLVTTIGGDFERHRAWEDQMGHVRNYARGELEAKLRDAGFVPVRTIYWGFPFYSPMARRLQDRMTSEPSYGAGTRLLARAMYALYFLNSSRRGDLLIALARPG